MMILGFLVFTILFSILAVKRLDWAIMLLIFALPAYLIRAKFLVPVTLLEVMIWVVFLVWLFKNFQAVFLNFKLKINKPGIKQLVDYPFKWEMVALLIIAFISAAVAGFNSEALGVWKAYFFEPVLLFIVILNVIGKAEIPLVEKLEKIIWPLVFSALAVSLFSVYQKFTGQFIPNPLWAAASTRRVTAFFGYPNAVGLYLEGIILLIVGYLFFVISNGAKQSDESFEANKNIFKRFLAFARDDKTKKTVLILTMLLSLLSIVFAKSVGASLGVGAGLIVFGLLVNKKVRWLVIGGLLIVIVGISSYQPAKHTALKYLTLNDFSGQVRRAQWSETIAMLRDRHHWLLGAGLDNYQTAIKPYHQPGIFVENYDDPKSHRRLVFDPVYRAAHWQPLEIFMYPHDIFLNFWSELGISGLLLFVWLFIKVFILGFKRLNTYYRPMAASLLAIITALLVHGSVDVPYFKNDLAVMFWLWLAFISLISLEKSIENQNQLK